MAVLTHRQQKGIDILIPLRLRILSENGRSETGWSFLTVQVKNRRKPGASYTVAGKHLDPIFTRAVHCDNEENRLCTRCLCMKERHYGIVLNVHGGEVRATERNYGSFWTFISPEAVHNGEERNEKLSKKRKLSSGNGEENVIHKAPSSANLIVNELSDLSTNSRSRCTQTVAELIENIVAQDTLSGIIERKTQQQLKAVQEVLDAALEGDRNYSSLVKTVDLTKRLARDVAQTYTTKS